MRLTLIFGCPQRALPGGLLSPGMYDSFRIETEKMGLERGPFERPMTFPEIRQGLDEAACEEALAGLGIGPRFL